MKLLSLILILAFVASGYSATAVTQVVTEGSTQCTAFVLKCEADTKEVGAVSADYTWTYDGASTNANALTVNTDYYAIDTSDATKFSQTIIVKPGTFAAEAIKPICSIQQKDNAGANAGSAAANANGTPTITVSANADCTSTPQVNNFQRLTGATGSEVCNIDLQIATGTDSTNKIFTIGGKSTADTVFNTGIQTLDATTTGTIYVIYAENGNDDQLIQVITGAAPTTLCNLKPLVDETQTTDACQSVVFKYTEPKEATLNTYDYDIKVTDANGSLSESSDFDLISNVTDTDIEFYIVIFENSAAAGSLSVYFQVYQYSDANKTTLIGDKTGVSSTLTMTKATCSSTYLSMSQNYANDCQFRVNTSYLSTPPTAGQWRYYGFNTHDVAQATTEYKSPNNDLAGIFLIQDGATNESAHELVIPEVGNCVGATVTYEDETVDATLGHLIFQRCTQDVTVTCNYTNLNDIAEADIKITWYANNNNDDIDWESETGKTITVPAGTLNSNTDVSVGCAVSYDAGQNIFDNSSVTIEYMQGDKPCTACPAASPSGTTTEADSANILCIVAIALLALIF